MKHTIHNGPRGIPSRASGFSLVELLVVVGIMLLLLALSVPALNSAAEGMDVTRAGDMVASNINLARQRAKSLNRPVLVRFFMPASEDEADGEETAGFDRVQLVKMEDDGELEPLTRITRLPDRVLISTLPGHGNFLDVSGQSMVSPQGDTLVFSEFTMRRNGSTDLDPSESAYLTIIPKNQTGDEAPSNFAIIMIDPVAGTVSQIRP